MAKPISQSDTRWVKKAGKKGYVEQISTGKRVTGKVKLVANTTKGKAGETQKYKRGIGMASKPMAAGGGVKPGTKPKAPAAAPARPAASPAKKADAPAKKSPARGSSALSMAERKKMQANVKKTGSYQAGSNAGSRKATSATVSSAAAAGKKAGPTDRRTGAEKTYDAAKSIVSKAAPKRAGLMTAADRAKEAKKRKMVKDTIARYMASRKK